jgi:transposase
MPRYKYYDYSQTVMIAIELEKQLAPGTIEYVIHKLVEERVDVKSFEEKLKNDETGRPAYDPKVLLKIILLSYSRGIISSRKIEQACKENVIFMAISAGQCPDHSTIAGFITTMEAEVLPLYRDILLVCEELKLLGGTSFALDGLKLPSNASKHWSGTHPELQKKKEKLEKKVAMLIQKHQKLDKKGNKKQDKDQNPEEEKQLGRLRRKADKIEKWLSENNPKIGKQGKEVKSNIIDNDSCKMSTSSGVIQGYNSQALVDEKHQIIVYSEAFGSGQDYSHVSPMIDGAKGNMKSLGKGEKYFKGKTLTADANYHSTENIKKCEEEKIDAYIPDVDFRKRDERFESQDKYKAKKVERYEPEDFVYDKNRDCYICPMGRKLTRKSSRGIEKGYRQYAGKQKECEVCENRRKCIRMPKGMKKYLTIPVEEKEGSISKRMQDKIDTKQGREKYERRLAIVEPVFANIRARKRMDRFTLRSKIKVNIQWTLYCAVHNLEKIANYAAI